MAVPLTLKVFKGDELIVSRDFARDLIKIGRLSSAHLCVDDEKVARIHAVITAAADDSLSILDMGSPEGTCVNGKRIERGPLKFGDEVKVGNTTIRVVQPSPSLDTPSVPSHIVSKSAFTPNEVAVVAEGVSVEAAARRPMRAQEAPPSAAVHSDVRGASVISHPFRREGAGPLGLELRFLWRGQMVGEFFLRPNVERTFRVGSAKGVQFEMGDTQLDSPSFDLVRFGKSGATLRFTSKMKGELQRRSGDEVMTLEQAQKQRLAFPDGAALALRVEHDDFVWVDLGGVVMQAFFQPSPKPVHVSLADTVDFTALNIFLALFFLASLSVISAANFGAQGMAFGDELTSDSARFAIWLTRLPEKNPIFQRLDKAKKEPGEIAQKHRNDQGQMGRKNAPERAAHAAPRGDPSRKEQVRDLLAKVFGHSGGGISTTFGRQELGGELKNALGHMFGAAAGDAAGFGGLALRGSASGGGGVGETIGIEGIRTQGKGGGTDRYGAAAGALNPKSSTEPHTRDTEIAVIGLLDKELIRKVIRSNRAQIKYCYESQLNLFPKLNGKIAVKFVISPAGSVSSSSVAQSTVGNAELEACVAGRVQAWIFPKPKAEGQVIVTYPFIFAQSGEGR